MPSLTQLANGNSDPTLVTITSNFPVVEPLDGPSTVDQVFDTFPEEVYQQGKDSHLYRLLTALGGDAGAGFIKAQTYAARLQFEAQYMVTTALDSFYGSQFSFPRLKNETYVGIDPNADALTPAQWDQVALADLAYIARIAEFWTATRNGNSPHGMIYAAQSGVGVECDLVENYKWLFDLYSDDPLELEPMGSTISTAEFVIIPRFENTANAADFEYTQKYPTAFTFTPPVLSNTRPATEISPPTGDVTVTNISEIQLLPEYERNMTDILDRLRSVGTLATITSDQTRYTEINLDAVSASSERVHVNRLVTGQTSVNWPDLDPSQGFFIQAGIENEATYFINSARELPVVFLTIENQHTYTEQALSDPTYNTSSFYADNTFARYQSEFVGLYSATVQALYPFLNGVSSNASFAAVNGVAINDTPLVLEARLS